MQCLSLFLFYFDIHGNRIHILIVWFPYHSFVFTNHWGGYWLLSLCVWGSGGYTSGSGHKTIILQHSGSRYQYRQERSSNGTSASHDQTKIQNENGDGSEQELETETENACAPIFGSIIEYCDYNGQRHSFPSNICTNSKPIIGKKKKVYFDPLDTSKGKDGSFVVFGTFLCNLS